MTEPDKPDDTAFTPMFLVFAGRFPDHGGGWKTGRRKPSLHDGPGNYFE